MNGSVIARSSQPNVGLLAWRMNEDELLLKAIADCCALTSVQQNAAGGGCKKSDSPTALNGADASTGPKPVQGELSVLGSRDDHWSAGMLNTFVVTV